MQFFKFITNLVTMQSHCRNYLYVILLAIRTAFQMETVNEH